jgi:hypothetical protein
MSKHTAGPWVVRGGYSIYANGGKTPVADACLDASVAANDEANAKHIVACVNACEGLPDGCLDGGWTALGASQYAKKLEAINTELLEALVKAKELLEQATEIDFDDMAHIAISSEDECDMRELIESVIAKARGEPNE